MLICSGGGGASFGSISSRIRKGYSTVERVYSTRSEILDGLASLSSNHGTR